MILWSVQSRLRIVETVAQMLAGSLSFIEGARRISGLRFDAEIPDDPDIVPFVMIDSETDALPLDPEVRKRWSPLALEKLQIEIDQAETWARQVGAPHCENLRARFQERSSD